MGTVVAVCHTVSLLHDLGGMADNDPSREHQVQEQMVEVGQNGTHTVVVVDSTYLYNTKEQPKATISQSIFLCKTFLFKIFQQQRIKKSTHFLDVFPSA